MLSEPVAFDTRKRPAIHAGLWTDLLTSMRQFRLLLRLRHLRWLLLLLWLSLRRLSFRRLAGHGRLALSRCGISDRFS